MTLKPQQGAALETDIGLAMAAAGARSAILTSARGLDLALETDGFWVRTTADAVAAEGRQSSIAERSSGSNRRRRVRATSCAPWPCGLTR